MGFFSRKSKGKKPDKKKPDTKKTDKKKPDTKEPAASNPDANKPDVKGKGKELPSQYRSVSIRINRESAPYVEEVDYDSDGYVVRQHLNMLLLSLRFRVMLSLGADRRRCTNID